MRADRLLALLLVLQARGRLTAAELADELEVSVRTIYRDMAALANAGVPVYSESGPGGGCRLLPGYRSPLDGLTRDEADALLILGVPAPVRELGLGGALDAAQQRVKHASPPTSSSRPRVHLDMPRWFHTTEPTPHLVSIAHAIRRDRSIVIRYATNEDGPGRTHPLEPLGLVNKAGLWYLVSGTTKGIAVFRVARVRAVEESGETFVRPGQFDLEAFWATWSADFTSSRPRFDVTVRVSPQALGILPEVLGDAARAAVDTAPPADADGWRVVDLWFEHLHAAVHRLVGFADLIEVMSPEEVRRGLVEVAERTLRRYSPSAPG